MVTCLSRNAVRVAILKRLATEWHRWITMWHGALAMRNISKCLEASACKYLKHVLCGMFVVVRDVDTARMCSARGASRWNLATPVTCCSGSLGWNIITTARMTTLWSMSLLTNGCLMKRFQLTAFLCQNYLITVESSTSWDVDRSVIQLLPNADVLLFYAKISQVAVIKHHQVAFLDFQQHSQNSVVWRLITCTSPSFLTVQQHALDLKACLQHSDQAGREQLILVYHLLRMEIPINLHYLLINGWGAKKITSKVCCFSDHC